MHTVTFQYDHCVNSTLHLNISALRIHMSQAAHDALAPYGGYLTEERGMTKVKVCRRIDVRC